MRRALISAAIVLLLATTANAETIAFTSTAGDTIGTLDVTRTYNSTVGLDEVLFKIASWSPTYSGREITSMGGTWSASSSSSAAGIYLGGVASSTTWMGLTNLKATTDDETGVTTYSARTAPQSYMNFTDYLTNWSWSRTASSATPVADKMYSSFYGGWSEASSTYWIGAGETLADLYVTPNANVTFTAANNGVDGVGLGGVTVYGSFTTAAVPEPATLAMLAAGLFGLVAYAWRKRK